MSCYYAPRFRTCYQLFLVTSVLAIALNHANAIMEKASLTRRIELIL
jgi:hypothetical protein